VLILPEVMTKIGHQEQQDLINKNIYPALNSYPVIPTVVPAMVLMGINTLLRSFNMATNLQKEKSTN
jgi:hypothetical protein